jgi:ParB family chromosome partitioning protein
MKETQVTPAQKSVLGKGLASLLSGAVAADPLDTGNRDRHPGISFASIDEIQVNPYQPRKEFDEAALEELTQSIRANGVIQPLIVRKVGNAYQLIAGERRLRAAKRAELKQVPIVIRKSTDRESLEIALIENIQRQDLNCIDEALAYLQLMQEFALTQEEVSTRVGKERATVANHLRLLKLPQPIQEDLKGEKLTFGHGKVLLSLDADELRMKLRAEILTQALSVRESERRAAEMKGEAPRPASAPHEEMPETPLQKRLQQLSQDLTRCWSAKVDVQGNEKKGKIVIHYNSPVELERLLEAMQNQLLWHDSKT